MVNHTPKRLELASTETLWRPHGRFARGVEDEIAAPLVLPPAASGAGARIPAVRVEHVPRQDGHMRKELWALRPAVTEAVERPHASEPLAAERELLEEYAKTVG